MVFVSHFQVFGWCDVWCRFGHLRHEVAQGELSVVPLRVVRAPAPPEK